MFNKVNSILLSLIVGVLMITGCTQIQEQAPEQKILNNQEVQLDHEILHVSLNEEFTLYENQSAIIENDNYEIKIIEFLNSPCPEDVSCYWSGIAIIFKYTYNGEVKQGINSVQAFGYQTIIIDTDHETYAKLKITKME